MKTRLILAVVTLGLFSVPYVSHLSSNPSMNGSAPGCGPSGGCHTFQSGILSLTTTNLQVRVTLTGNSGSVAGELVDSTGTVVAMNNSTSSNPFTLTAPRAGRYTVNAGYKNPSRRWDSTRVVLSVTGVGERDSEKPGAFQLEQNYPNPFNPATTIEYVIPVSGTVTLKIFDGSGREVGTIVNGWQHSGRHRVVWSGAGLATGLYFYRLSAENYSETKKLLLMK